MPIPFKVLAACFLAGCLEIYDFTIFGFLSTILYREYLQFLPPELGILVSYALFGVGFIFRPLGSIIFGYIGDRFGRKKSFILSSSLMGFASLTIFALPNYQTIGYASCVIIVLVRILQGISVGGEYSGAIIYAVEHAEKAKAGIVGSIVVSGCMSGVLLASSVGIFVQKPFMPNEAWRFAFLLGFGLSIISFFIRQRLQETPQFLALGKNKARQIPLFIGLKSYKLEAGATLLIAATNGINLYFTTVFLPKYLSDVLQSDTSYFALMTTSIMVILIPFFGRLSDQIGRARQTFYGLLILAIFDIFMLPIIYHIPQLWLAQLMIVAHALVASIQSGSMNSYIVEIFPVECRFSCSALFYSLGMGVIGGSSPFLAALIVQNAVDMASYYLAMYMSTVTALACALTWLVNQKRLDIRGKNAYKAS